jgi:hypothetical protein
MGEPADMRSAAVYFASMGAALVVTEPAAEQQAPPACQDTLRRP